MRAIVFLIALLLTCSIALAQSEPPAEESPFIQDEEALTLENVCSKQVSIGDFTVDAETLKSAPPEEIRNFFVFANFLMLAARAGGICFQDEWIDSVCLKLCPHLKQKPEKEP